MPKALKSQKIETRSKPKKSRTQKQSKTQNKEKLEIKNIKNFSCELQILTHLGNPQVYFEE